MVVIDKLTSMMLFGTYKSIGIQVKLYGDVKYTVVEVVSNSNDQNDSLVETNELLNQRSPLSPYSSIKLQFYIPYYNYLRSLGYCINSNKIYYDYLYLLSKNQEDKNLIIDYLDFYDIDTYITKETLEEAVLRSFNSGSKAEIITFFILITVSLINLVNIMIFSIKSRTQEIGIRRALGASRAMIYMQVTSEMVLFLMMSCGMGISLALVFNIIINYSYHNEIYINFGYILIIYLSSIIIGIIFSILPAYKTSKIKISDALRII